MKPTDKAMTKEPEKESQAKVRKPRTSSKLLRYKELMKKGPEE